MEKEQLVEIANTEMPFGKYKGRRLIDLPEEYLLWFARKDEFPAGRLGELMAITAVDNPGSVALLAKLGFAEEAQQQLEGYDGPSRVFRLQLQG